MTVLDFTAYAGKLFSHFTVTLVTHLTTLLSTNRHEMEYNLYSNAEVTFSHLDQDADECFSKDSPSWTKTKCVITHNGWTLVLLAGLCFALLCGLTALGVLYVKKTNMSDFLEAQNMNLSASLSTVQQKLAATRPCRECDSGWKKHQGQCYFFSKEKKTWTQSHDYCLSVGAQLVIINGQQEQTFVSESIIETCWIGLSDLETEGQWYWVDGSSLNATETK
ncbi:hypothetical protein JZ751_029227 [Albula glossodonta]|uniref:C-type lectin domain-containing protein n=1 Tax=Albula glossodonta TaxID=121402 RepID=A0A8T2PAC2_9TELE|nr:hypothetical protein JZ751_029227 [Albula glossodonta]